jgi:hypothetical protein
MPSSDASARRPSRWRWGTPLAAVSLGVAYLIAGWLGDDLQFGVVGMLLMSGIAAGMLVAARLSETVAGLLDRRDERINLIDTQATVFAGMAVISAVIIGFVVEIARGQDGAPYSMLGAIGGTSYVAALLVLRFRR